MNLVGYPALQSIHSKIRARFPLIEHDGQGNPRLYLNTGAGSLMVDAAIEAMSLTSGRLNPMPGIVCPAEIETGLFHGRVRGIVADFLHVGNPNEISFHLSATAALFNLAYALGDTFNRDNNFIVTDLDHMANISPWEAVWGEGMGCEIRHARVTAEGTLDLDHLLSLVDSKTGIIAVTMASNGLGSIVPLSDLTSSAKEKCPDVLVCVDAVHHALHGSLDVRETGCDFLVFSGYKVFGPMLGVLWGKASLLEKLRPYRVETNKNEAPYKFEMGMLNNASLAALEASLEYLLWISDEIGAAREGASLKERPDRFRTAMRCITEFEQTLSVRILNGFKSLDSRRITLHGIDDPTRVNERDPTFGFEIIGQSAFETKKTLWEEHAIQIADGNHYSAAVTRHLKKTALCRASFAHYDTMGAADRLIEALGLLTESRNDKIAN